jgi:hemoglobin/transferrin/lactoferrin receptor protein
MEYAMQSSSVFVKPWRDGYFISLILLFSIISVVSFSQTIIVIDKTTQQAIAGVSVYSHSPLISQTSNAKGEIDALIFKYADSIYFKYVGYETTAYTFPQLESLRFKVELNESSMSLGEIIVSANRWEENEIENPYRIEKISRREASFQNPQTSADLLATNGYVYIQKSQMAGGSPMLRGFATNRVMLVIDGVRMNNAIFRSGNVQNVISLDAASMESTEILFGPGAVMYGSDAIGGVMDFHSLRAILADSTENSLIHLNTFSRFSSANRERSGHIDFNFGFKKIAFLTNFSFSDYGDLRAGSNGNSYFLRPAYQETINGTDTILLNEDSQLQIPSAFSQLSFMHKILIKPTNHLSIDYGFYYSATSNAPRYDRLTLDDNEDDILDYAEWYYGPQQWMMNRLGMVHSASNKFYDQLRILTAFQKYEESRHDRKFNSTSLRNQTETVDALSLNIDLDKKIKQKTNLFYGAEAVYNLIGSVANNENIESGEKEPANTRYPDGSTWQAYGLYASLKYKLNTKWIFNTGMRYSYYMIKADFDTSSFPFPFVYIENKNGALNGSLGCVFSANANWQIYLNASTGFRAPNIDDIGKVFESEPGSVVVPNPDLKPEYAYNAELGSARILGSFLKIDFAAYYTLLDNALARRNFQYNGEDSILYDGEMSRVQAIQNIAKAYVYGLQAGIEINFGKGFVLKSSFNYQYGEEQSEDSLVYYPKSHLAPAFGSTHFIYQRKKFEFDIYTDYNAGYEYEDLPLSERNDDAIYAKDENGLPFVPAWYTLNFKTALYANSNISINIGIENITDRLYRTYSSGISAPGRNFIISLRGMF